MNLLQQSVLDNRLLLEELQQLLSKVYHNQFELYSQAIPLLNGISIGSHVRHILEHYQIFFKGLQAQVPIDYDHRSRCVQCQSSVVKAQEIITEILHDLDAMPKNDEAIAVSIITNPGLSDMVSQSSILREMQFLQSHTVHHLAIMGIALRQNGLDVSGNLSKAPSTLQFELKS